ncbi:MBL fold metallo-hydrolase [Cellulomonas sp. URHE0023]|uniref:MBL fold metallo-hydrolase n=1 Tax=Cellulomonas sp. URHE0023 TaxID=1380354 RepID=UPI0005540B15|nr:MBL fold metallo-hydrolase [Cellulomonas sp. URHE0023]
MSGTAPTEVVPGVFRVADTCHVYVVVAEHGSGRTGIAIDFGSGAVLDELDAMGVDRITDVLLTHHHRDQAQGLPRAVAAGIRVHVPPVERDLFDRVDEMWRTRPLDNDYNLRQDRFSLLAPVPVDSVVPEYRTASYGGVDVEVLPTPGHTVGSVTYLVRAAGLVLAFSGDLVYAPGKVWSLAASQWSYTDTEGPAMTVLSAYLLTDRGVDLLLPSHGDVMDDPRHALGLLATRMRAYVDSRRPLPWDLRTRWEDPYLRVTEHLLLNTSSLACSYVLLSRSGAALLIDYGYDMTTGLPAGYDRASRRPWLASLPALRRTYGVGAVEVVLATHYHDDHVAGMNLLRDVEGTQVWAAANVAPVLESPAEHDLPCLWFDPVPVDRVLPLGATVSWREYEITVHELPGHTLFAAAFEVVVDGTRVLVTGDQQDGLGIPGRRREVLNYQYRNRFRVGDYRDSARLYREVAPGVMVSGHWEPRWVDDPYLEMLAAQGEEVVRVHRDLLPLDELDLGADGVLARATPYRARLVAGEPSDFTVQVRNPFAGPRPAVVRTVVPGGWRCEPRVATTEVAGGGVADVHVSVTACGPARRRVPVAFDVSIGELRLGQHAEAVLEVVDA